MEPSFYVPMEVQGSKLGIAWNHVVPYVELYGKHGWYGCMHGITLIIMHSLLHVIVSSLGKISSQWYKPYMLQPCGMEPTLPCRRYRHYMLSISRQTVHTAGFMSLLRCSLLQIETKLHALVQQL